LPAFALAVLVAGCSVPLAPKEDAPFQSYASTNSRPATRPVRSISSFSDALMCMDRMMREAEIPTTLITSKQIPDYSGRVPVAAKDMVITALSQMSRLSNAFRYVDFEVDIARQDTVQNLTTILLNNNQMQLQRPALYVSGAVSFVDHNVITSNFGGGLSGERVEAGYARNRAATIVGLEMHLADFRTRTMIPGLDSANEIIVGTSGQGMDLAGKIGTYGVQFNVGRDLAQGTGSAMRTLVELAVIELAGKWTRLPYWRCLTLDNTHPEFQRQLREWFDEGDRATHGRMVQRYLVSQGYLPAFEQPLSANSSVLREAVAQFQADMGMVVTGEINFPTYERALRDFVAIGEDGLLARVGWPELGQGQVPVAPLAVEMQIENAVRDRTVFEAGTQVFASVTVSRAAHLFCFLHDAVGNVVRIQPTLANPSSLVSANLAVRLPDWMVPYPAFLLETGEKGHEAIMCIATNQDPMPQLPMELQAPALTRIKMPDLQAVQDAFRNAVGAANMASDTLHWHVIPRRQPPAGVAPTGAPAASRPATST
jgi:hypothetical protein